MCSLKRHRNFGAGGKPRILDLASSSGIPAVPLAQAFPTAQIVATDLSPSAVDLIRKHAEAKGVYNVAAQFADAQNLLEFGDDTFAAVTCSYGLMFMPEHQKALTEAYRVLQPGGLFVATVFAALDSYQFGWVSLIVTWVPSILLLHKMHWSWLAPTGMIGFMNKMNDCATVALHL